MATNPPKQLQLTTATVRNQRTLIWLQNQSTAVHWSKWDGIVTNIADYEYWSNYDAKIVGMIIIDSPKDTESFLEKLYEISKVIPMILISQSVLSLKSQEYWTENFDNIMNLSTMMESFPFVEAPWDGTIQDAIAMFAMLCRYNRVVDCTISKQRQQIIATSITFSNFIQPNQTWLFTQFFRHKNNRRFKEIKDCLMKNCESSHIDKIVLLNEKNYSNEWKYFPGSQKVQQVILGKRLTYADFLQYVHDQVPDNVFTILCNADIYFEDSIRDLFKIDMKNKMLALLRWDVDPSGNSTLFGPRADSQDSWIFLSNSIRSRTWNYSKFNIPLGQPGCDNAFAGQILRNHFVISNPSLTFKSFHLHNTNIRNYDIKDSIASDIYVNIVPSNMIDTKQEKEPDDPPHMLSHELVQFDIKSSSMSNEITYCTMLEKEERYHWEPSTQNFYFEAAIPVYSWKKASVTPNGLVYDLYHIYKGVHSENPLYNYWMCSSAEIFTPLVSRKKMAAIPFKDTSIFQHPDTYLLYYVSKLKRLLSIHPDLSFWLPKDITPYLNRLEWDYSSLSPVELDEFTAVWAEQVVGLLPGPESSELGKEDIDQLRMMLPNWKSNPTPFVCAFLMDQTVSETFIKEHIIPSLLEKNSNWVIRYISESDPCCFDQLQGVSLCVFVGGKQTVSKWSKLWALPKDCCVIEFQQELQLHGEFQHLAHVAEWKSWVLLLAKGSKEDVQDQISKQFKKWLHKNYEEYMG
jgi:hypothetical protein